MHIIIWVKMPNGEQYAVSRENDSVGYDATLLEEVAQLMERLDRPKISKVNSKPIVKSVEPVIDDEYEEGGEDNNGGSIFEM